MPREVVTDDYRGPGRRDVETSWHLDKKIPISFIASLVLLTVSGFSAYRELKTDVELVKATGVTLTVMDAKISADHQQSLVAIASQLTTINSRMDQLYALLLSRSKQVTN